MAIKFLCPYGHRLRVPDDRAGKKGRCPICHQRVFVPVANPRPSGRRKQRPAAPTVRPEPLSPLEEIVARELGLKQSAPPADSPSPPAPLPPQDMVPPPPAPQGGSSPGTTPPLATMQALPYALPPRGPELFSSAPAAESRPLGPAPSWLAVATADNWRHGYQLDGDKRQTAWLLALGMAAVAVLSTVPTWTRLDPAQSQTAWVPIVLVLGGVQLCCALWLATLPDWSTLRIGSALCGATVVVYLLGVALAVAARQGRPTWIDVSEVQNMAGSWCASMTLLFGLLGYALGHTSVRWRRDTGDSKPIWGR